MKQWKCMVCGFVHKGDSPPDKCPVCGADKSQFILLDETAADETAQPDTLKAVDGTSGTARKWRCTVCGYIHNGPEPPDKCPVCGADKSMFEPVEDNGAEEEVAPSKAGSGKDEGDDAAAGHPWAQRFKPSGRWEEMSRHLTRLHGHPIAVHIPNGLLPISVLFTLVALLFGAAGFATAAKYNTIIVALAMPLVVATGWVDWINRFGGRMSPVFRMKMICAGVVTGLSIVLAIWWLARPDLYQNGLFGNFFFVVLNLGNLAAAGVAGWYGGKLVFNK